MLKTEIINLALSYIGKGRINDIEDLSEEAKQAKIHYDHVRRQLLARYPWGFTRTIKKLALVAENVMGWRYLYGYPTSLLQITYVYDEDGAARKETQRAEFETLLYNDERVIASNTELAYAEGIGDVVNTELYPEEFTDAFAHMLAAQLAYPLTGSAQLAQQHLQSALLAGENAKYQAAIEKEKETEFPMRYRNQRFR